MAQQNEERDQRCRHDHKEPDGNPCSAVRSSAEADRDRCRARRRRPFAIVGFRATSNRLVRVFFIAHPLLMAVTVTATGNHYFIDSIAGALAALVMVALYRRSRSGASCTRRAINSFQ